MLVRVGIAVTCTVAALTFSQLKLKSPFRNRDDPKVHDEEFIFKNIESQQKTPEEEVKRVNTVSPARSLHGGSDNGGPDLLLPEFEDLLRSTELGGLSPCSEINYGKENLGAEEFSNGDGHIHKKPPKEQTTEEAILIHKKKAKSRARGKVGSRRSSSPGGKNQLVEVHSTDGEDRNMSSGASEISDPFPDETDFLLGEYVDSLANDAAELEALRNSVKDLKEKETRLLEYYGLQKNDFLELEGELEKRTTWVSKLEAELQEKVLQLGESQSELEEKKSQITKLKTRMGVLESRTSKLSDEAASVGSLKKDLDEARARSRELQKQVHSDSGNARAELLMLKQKLVTLEAEKQDGNKRDMDVEKKLQTLRELEVEVVELRRTSKELQHQKRELTVKLTAAETEIENLQNMAESNIVGDAYVHVAALRHENEDLCRQVEGLQNDRFTEVEELVYLRWVNACLRYELRNSQVPAGTSSAMELNKSLSPKSQEKAKALMLQYAGPDLLAMRVKDQMDSGCESPSSEASTPSEEVGEYSDVSSDVGSGRLGKRPSLIRRLKKWTGRKDDGSDISSASSSMERERSFSNRSDPTDHRKSSSSKGPLEALILKNASDANEIITFGANEVGNASPRRSVSDMSVVGRSDATSRSNIPHIRTNGSDKDSGNGIAASFELISKSVPREISAKYPAFKDRHKAAVEREHTVKEKVQAERSKVAKVKFQKGFQEVAPEKPASEPTLRRAEVISKPLTAAEVEKRATRKPKPPPKPSGPMPAVAAGVQVRGGSGGPPPPPPPPPRSGVPGAPTPPPPPPMGGKLQGKNQGNMQRAPEVVEFYQSLLKRDVKSNAANGASGGNNADARNDMIGEIENRSAHLLAIKADVETQGEFVLSLATEVRAATYTNIEDVVAFVTWLDDELSFLVDETAVLKHFDWPESKADALREAAFEYQDLMKLLAEVSVFEDKPEVPCEKALKRMLTSLEKMEQSVYGLLRTRDMAIARYKEFGLPTRWLLDSGVVGKIKSASVKLARLYMKRVASELDRLDCVNEPVREFLLLQGVRFAFRVHQFAGGFDPESMRAFEALRNCAHVRPQNSPLRTDVGDEEGIQGDDEGEET